MTGSCVSSCCRSASITAAHGAPDAADAGIFPRQAPHHIPGAVGGVVVDEDDFPGDARQRGLQPPKERGDIVALVEGRDDDRKLRQTRSLRRVLRSRSDGFIHAASVYPQPPGKPRRGPKTPVGKTWGRTWGKTWEGPSNGPKEAPKCQRPRTTGARTSGAAELFSGRPSAGAMKHRRRR